MMRLPPTSTPTPIPTPAVIDSPSESAVERVVLLEAFADLSDVRRAAGKGHPMALGLALVTLVVTAGH